MVSGAVGAIVSFWLTTAVLLVCIELMTEGSSIISVLDAELASTEVVLMVERTITPVASPVEAVTLFDSPPQPASSANMLHSTKGAVINLLVGWIFILN
jgi:hypothetical protein